MIYSRPTSKCSCLEAPTTVALTLGRLAPLGVLELRAVVGTVAQSTADGATAGPCIACVGVLETREEGRDPGARKITSAKERKISKARASGLRGEPETHRCLASLRRYLRSSSVCSLVFMLTKVVAIPVLPLRPVRPI